MARPAPASEGDGSAGVRDCDKTWGKRGSQSHARPPTMVQRAEESSPAHSGLGAPRADGRHREPATTMSKDTYTSVSDNGLRYESKLGGSPFLGSGHTRSCFKCGKHRTPNNLMSKRVLGRTEVVCKPACVKPEKQA